MVFTSKMSRRIDFNGVEQWFNKRGYILLSKPKDCESSKSYFRYICLKHEDAGEQRLMWGKRKTKGCVHCKKEEINKVKLTKAQEDFACLNLILLDDEYKNTKTKMKFICNIHPNEIQEKDLDHIRRGQGCQFCTLEYKSELHRMDFSRVKESFEDINLTLLIDESKYINAHQELPYKCNNHPEIVQYKTYNKVQQGQGCAHCWDDSRGGEKESNWQGGITDLRRYLRNEVNGWKKDALISQNYTCYITKSRGGDLEVHHPYSFNLIVDDILSGLSLDIRKIGEYNENVLKLIKEEFLALHNKYDGIVLAKEVHKEFHSIYGYGNNTPQQFEEFKEMKRSELIA